MNKILALFYFASIVVCKAEKKPSCLSGSSYWCANYHHAKECQALLPCRQYIWKPHLVDHNPCPSCHESVESMFQNIGVEAKIQMRKSLHDYCYQLEEKNQQCLDFVENNENFLFHQLQQLTSDKELWCNWLCDKHDNEIERCVTLDHFIDRFTNRLIRYLTSNEEGLICINCQLILTQVTNILRRPATKGIVLFLLESSCSNRSRLHQQCKALVDIYGELLLVSVIDRLTPVNETCARNSFCETVKSNNVNKIPRERAVNAGVICDTCKEAVEFLSQQASINQSEKAMEENLKVFCATLSQQRQEYCIGMVKLFGKMVIANIHEATDPELVCVRNFLCSSIKSRQSSITSLSTIASTTRLNIDVCHFCIDIVTLIERSFRLNETEAAIKLVISSICVVLPEEYEEKCIAFVDDYGGRILDKLIYIQNPEFICESLYYCPPELFPRRLIAECETCSPLECSLAQIVGPNFDMLEVETAAGKVCRRVQQVTELQSLCKSNDYQISSSTDVAVCDICKKIVAYVRGFLRVNQTLEVLRTTVFKSCSLLPHDQQVKCEKIIDEYGERLIETIRSETSPSTICNIVFFCPINQTQLVVDNLLNHHTSCSLCQQVIAYLYGAYHTEQNIKRLVLAFEDACSIIPLKHRTECQNALAKHKTEVLLLIRDKKCTRMICERFKFCSPRLLLASHFENYDDTKISASLPCETCKDVVSFVEGALLINSSLDALKRAVVRACVILPKKQEIECMTQVAAFSDVLIEMILKGLSPQVVCEILALCPVQSDDVTLMHGSNTDICDTCTQAIFFLEGAAYLNNTLETIESVVLLVCDLFDGKQQEQCETNITQYTSKIMELVRIKLNPTSICKILLFCPRTTEKGILVAGNDKSDCETCREIVLFIEETFKFNRTLEAVQNTVTFICNILPEKEELQCLNDTRRNARLIIVAIRQQLNPRFICKNVGLCKPELVATSMQKFKRSGTLCDVCIQVTAYLEGAFRVNQTMEALRQVALDSCSLLPLEDEDECRDDVMKRADEIITLVQQRLQPFEICNILYLCPPQKACGTCKQAVAYVEGTFKLNQTMVSLQTAVLQVCSILPLESERFCKGVLRNFTTNIVKMIKARINPTTVCQVLSFCNATKSLTMYNNGPFCTMCKLAAVVTHNHISNLQGVSWLPSMREICHFIPSDQKLECGTMVQEYGNDIIYELQEGRHYSNICEVVDLCIDDHVWYDNGCHNGQEYWCANFNNALKCKALRYCIMIRA